jgi:hypothetical protein
MDERQLRAMIDEMRGQTLTIIDEMIYQNGLILEDIRIKLEFLVEEQKKLIGD